VFGVHDGKVYRSLGRTDYSEEVVIRRLQVSDRLRKSRSDIRTVAPSLWPNLTERQCRDADEYGADAFGASTTLLPTHYHEEDRDRWDGSRRWLREKWLWQDCPNKPEGVQVNP